MGKLLNSNLYLDEFQVPLVRGLHVLATESDQFAGGTIRKAVASCSPVVATAGGHNLIAGYNCVIESVCDSSHHFIPSVSQSSFDGWCPEK